MSTKYVYSADMRSITPSGSDYEESVRSMVIAALKWLDEHPKAQPVFYGMEGATQDNDDAEQVISAMNEAVPNSSGSMLNYALITILSIRKQGWEAYCQQMRGKAMPPKANASSKKVPARSSPTVKSRKRK